MICDDDSLPIASRLGRRHARSRPLSKLCKSLPTDSTATTQLVPEVRLLRLFAGKIVSQRSTRKPASTRAAHLARRLLYGQPTTGKPGVRTESRSSRTFFDVIWYFLTPLSGGSFGSQRAAQPSPVAMRGGAATGHGASRVREPDRTIRGQLRADRGKKRTGKPKGATASFQQRCWEGGTAPAVEQSLEVPGWPKARCASRKRLGHSKHEEAREAVYAAQFGRIGNGFSRRRSGDAAPRQSKRLEQSSAQLSRCYRRGEKLRRAGARHGDVQPPRENPALQRKLRRRDNRFNNASCRTGPPRRLGES